MQKKLFDDYEIGIDEAGTACIEKSKAFSIHDYCVNRSSLCWCSHMGTKH